MKNGKTLGSLLLAPLVAVMALSLSGCGKDVLDYRNVQVVNGKIYKGDANKPFSGTLTNVPDNEILQNQEAFAQIAPLIVRLADPREVPAAQNLGISWVGMLTVKTTSYCDVNVKDGWFDGEAVCKAPRSDDKTTTMNFKEGRLDGKFKYFDSVLSPNLLAEATFNDKGADGTLTVYSPRGGKAIGKIEFSDGKMDGKAETFNDNGDLLVKAAYKEGKLDGTQLHYTNDGKTKIEESHWSKGQKDGDVDFFYADSGKKREHSEWKNGKLEGVAQRWDQDGKLTMDQRFKDGNQVEDKLAAAAPAAAPAAQAPATDVDACVKHWVDAFHKEQGQDAMIAADQLDEWSEWCKQGKQAPSA